jgi:hypothetical protein
MQSKLVQTHIFLSKLNLRRSRKLLSPEKRIFRIIRILPAEERIRIRSGRRRRQNPPEKSGWSLFCRSRTCGRSYKTFFIDAAE